MNLSRPIAALLSSTLPRRRPLHRHLAAASIIRARRSKPKSTPTSSLGGSKETKSNAATAELSPRPSEIPYQAKVANSVQLVGRIAAPVELQSLPNGAYTAASVLVQEKAERFPQLWIPIIFQGQMAQIAAFYLKKADIIYVTGRLFGDVPPSGEDSQGTIKVLVHSLNFVQQKDGVKDGRATNETDELILKSSEVKESSEVLHLWEDLLANPHKWCDNRSNKSYQNSAAFRHKDTGQLLWINEPTPESILLKLDTLSFGHKAQEKIGNKNNLFGKNLWTDLLVNTQDWWDNRMDKENKKNPKLPDFKHKDNQKALWLDGAPNWVLAKLDGLVFSSQTVTKRFPKGLLKDRGTKLTTFSSQTVTKRFPKENLWRSIVDNPTEWWDNRSDKLKPNYPDFKHKETGEALWLNSSTPEWVLPKLPKPKTKRKVGATKKDIQFTVPT